MFSNIFRKKDVVNDDDDRFFIVNIDREKVFWLFFSFYLAFYSYALLKIRIVSREKYLETVLMIE